MGGRAPGWPPSSEPDDLPLIVVRSHAFNYSETFIDDHVHHLSQNRMVLHGFPFPRWMSDGRSVLEPGFEQALQDAGINREVSAEVWRRYTDGLASFLTRSGARVLLLESGVMAAFVHAACEQARLPYVVHFHGVDAFGQGILARWSDEYRKFFPHASALVVVSQAMRMQLLRLGAPADRVVLAPYGVNIEVPRLAAPATAGPRFVAVGRFVEKKAPQLTLLAFAAVRKRCRDAQLVMIGDGPLLEPCREWARSSGLLGAVTFKGAQSREAVSAAMAASAVFVQHSVTAVNGDSEGLPLAILEAGAHGLPVVSTRHAGIPDAVREGVDGILVDERDVTAMAKGMLQLVNDPGRAADMGKAFRERVVESYGRATSVQRLRKILNAAITDSPTRGGSAFAATATGGKPPPQGPAIAPVAGPGADGRGSPREAIAADRNNIAAYLELGALALRRGERSEAYRAFAEARRLGGDTEPARAALVQLEAQGAALDPPVAAYRRRCAGQVRSKGGRSRRILVITNLLPPQEMGGYGRTMWEFSRELTERGHTVRVLTADLPHLERNRTEEHTMVERYVARTLRLFGDWKNGAAVAVQDPRECASLANANRKEIARVAAEFSPEVVIAGNLDFVGAAFLQDLLDRGVPVVHRLGNARPGYAPPASPRSPLYCLAGCSEWVNRDLRTAGYPLTRFAVLPPGSPLFHYYRAFPPQRRELRIAFAGLLMPYKGAHVLVEALAYLARVGIAFECTIAGDSTAPEYVRRLKEFALKHGFAGRVDFAGFLSKEALAALFSRCNTLVFPSTFPEPFGKTQIEAMAAGLVVVSSGTGGSTDIVRDGDTGVIFRNGDARDLAAKLAALSRTPDLAARIAAAGQEHAFSFTTEACVDRLERIIDDLTKDAERRRSVRGRCTTAGGREAPKASVPFA